MSETKTKKKKTQYCSVKSEHNQTKFPLFWGVFAVSAVISIVMLIFLALI